MTSYIMLPIESLTEEQASHELARLSRAIREHDAYYWEDDAPVISDAEYNRLKQRNNDIESRFPHLVREDSPTLKEEIWNVYRSAKSGLDVPIEDNVELVDSNVIEPDFSLNEIDLADTGLISQAAGVPVNASPGGRGLDDGEISLIKSMLLRGMRNAEIQFYFNRPDRRVNSGRITEIKSGSRGQAVMPAADDELDRFLSDFTVSGAVPPVPLRRGGASASVPTEEQVLASLFIQDKAGNWRLARGETDEVECKREINVRKLSPVVRAMAGMANNKGGIIFIGVEDKSGRVIGLADDEFERMDPVKVTSAAQAHLQPVPIFTKGVVKIGDTSVGYIKVSRSLDGPVIVFSSGDRMDNGSILFRYNAETACIRFGELRNLLDERDARRFRELAAVTQRIAEIGVSRTAILNTEDGRLDMEGGRQLTLDSTLLDSINFIREGEFNEVEGAPTLKVVGEIAAVGGKVGGTARRLITDEDVLRNFLDQETVLEPLEYIRFAAAASDRSWAPIFYFARQAGLNTAQLTEFIEGVETSKRRRRRETADRAKGARSSFSKHPGSPARRLSALLAGDFSPPTEFKKAEQLAMAIQGLPNAEVARLEDLLLLVRQCREVIVKDHRFNALSNIYRAAARIDEVFFGDEAKSCRA